MVSINNVKKATSLLRKELGIEISKFSKEGVKDIKVPEEAISYDAVKVGREANPEAHFTDIYTFRDKDGNIVSTVHNKIDNEKIRQTVKKYSSQTEDSMFIDTEESFDCIPIKRQTIRGYEKENGKYTKCFEEHRAVNEDKNEMESLVREVYPGSDEIIKISHFEKGKSPRFIKSYYEKQEIGFPYTNAPEFIRGRLMEKAIKEPTKYAGSYILKDVKVSNEELKELAGHQYFLPYFSPDNKFIYRMSRQVEKETDAINNGSSFVSPYSKKSNTGGFCSRGMGSYIIGINRLKADGAERTRNGLVNTIGHEYGHANWEEKASEYEVFSNIMEDTAIPKKELDKIKKYIEANENYVQPEENIEKYKENFTEIVARQEGRKTSDKYDELENMTRKHFPALENLYKKDPDAEVDVTSYLLKELFRDMKYTDL